MAKTYKIFKPEEGLRGPYKLDDETIAKIPEDTYVVYLLVSQSTKGNTIVRYVGRGDLRERMTEHVEEKEATAFYFKILKTEEQGWSEECRLFHDYGEQQYLDNINHPPIPAGSKSKVCPFCFA
jgi:hypothetical protein